MSGSSTRAAYPAQATGQAVALERGLGRRQRVLVGRRQVGGELERLEGRLGPADPLQELAVPAVRPCEIAR